MDMRKFIICLVSAISIFTASVAEGFCCVEDKGSCETSQEEHSHEQGDEHSQKDVGSHSCCHAHHVTIRAEKIAVAEPIGIQTNYSIINKQLITQHEAGVLLEPPSRA